MSKRKLSFEEALKQLEVIAEQIERGEIGLEESVRRYEEGMALVKQCREALASAELRIQQLQEKPDGSVEIRDFPRPAAMSPANDAEDDLDGGDSQ